LTISHRLAWLFGTIAEAASQLFASPDPERSEWDALRKGRNTRTTTPQPSEQSDSTADPDRFRKLVERIANWTDAEVEAVSPAQTRHIARVVVEGASPDYPVFAGIGMPELTTPTGWTDAGHDWLAQGAPVSALKGSELPQYPGSLESLGKAARRAMATADADQVADAVNPKLHWRGIPLSDADALVLGIDTAIADGPEARYLVRKGGIFYRPDARGYTSDRARAGRFSLVEAVKHSHPNGMNGPRDGMSYELDETTGDQGDAAIAEAIRQSISDGVVSIMPKVEAQRAALDPSPEEQRANFERIAATPRPTAVDIKDALDSLERHALNFERRSPYPGHAEDMRHYAAMIDRLGVEVLTLDGKLADATRQLDQVASNAKPVDDTDLAELVQVARLLSDKIGRGGMWHGSPGTMGRHSIGGKETSRTIDRLIAALNDQVRQRREAEAQVERFDVTKPIDRRQNALLLIDVLANAKRGVKMAPGDYDRAIGTIRQLLAERDDMELHRDAARDALSDMRDERDTANIERLKLNDALNCIELEHAANMADLRAELEAKS